MVEHPLGKGEVVSSILTGGTRNVAQNQHLNDRALPSPPQLDREQDANPPNLTISRFVPSHLAPPQRGFSCGRLSLAASPSDHGRGEPVCTENLVRVDLMRESLNVSHDGRADILFVNLAVCTENCIHI
jgi:hypothetical protein